MEKVAKKSRKMRRLSKDKVDETESDIEDANFGDHITYDVLRMMLEYFSFKDLSRAAMVCRSWKEAVHKEIQARLFPQSIVCEFNYKKKRPPPLKNFTDKLFIKPSVGLLFVGRLIKSNLWHLDSRVENGCLCDHLPCPSDYITISNYGVVHDDLEMEGDFLSGFFLPEIPNVNIKCFSTSVENLTNLCTMTSRRSQDKFAKELCKISPNEENIKCIIMFVNEEYEDLHTNLTNADQILKSLLSNRTKESEQKIAIWGGVGRKVTICSCKSDPKICTKIAPLAGISICGSSVSTWTIILDCRIKTKAQTEKELILFRDSVKLQKYSFGFMFSCCARGEQWYSERHVEAKIFRKLFPNVPLVGSFGGGEFGISTVPQEHSVSRSIVHQYSTIFLIVSYGSIKQML